MLLYGTTTFAALARIAMPWFRSAGIYADQLRKSADALDRFVLRMQSESLARTEHSPLSILQEQIAPTTQVPGAGQGALDSTPYLSEVSRRSVRFGYLQRQLLNRAVARCLRQQHL